MLILWVYFMVPLLIGANIPGFVTMLVILVLYEAAFLSEVVRAGIWRSGAVSWRPPARLAIVISGPCGTLSYRRLFIV